MSVAIVQTRSGATGSSNTLNVSITTTAGNLLGYFTQSLNATGSAPTRTGETVNSAVANFSDASGNNNRVDYSMNIGGTANAVTFTGANTHVNGCVCEFSGAATSNALGASHTTNTTAGGATIQPGSITPTAGSELWTGFATPGVSGSTAGTIDSSFTVNEAGGAGTVWDTANLAGGTASHDNVAAVATNPTWTNNSAGTGMSAWMVEFLASGGGGGGAVAILELRRLCGAGV